MREGGWQMITDPFGFNSSSISFSDGTELYGAEDIGHCH